MSILNEMTFYALDENFDLIIALDGYNSIIWTEKYSDIGDFEMFGPNNEQMIDVMANAKYIYNNLTRTLMIIEKRTVENTEEDGSFIAITGSAFSQFLDRRIMLNQITIQDATYTTPFSSIISYLVNISFINTTSTRQWDQLSISDNTVDSPELDAGVLFGITLGENLLDIVLEIAKANKLGIKCEYETSDKTTDFIIYDGINRVSKSPDYFVFSDLYDNLKTLQESLNSKHVKNVALVIGSAFDDTTGLPKSPQLLHDLDYTGLERRETLISVDQDVTIYDLDGDIVGEMTAGQYTAAISKRGDLELANKEYKDLLLYDGSILETEVSVYGEHYNLGDVIGFINQDGLIRAARISSVTFSDDAKDGKTIVPEFDSENIEDYI